VTTPLAMRPGPPSFSLAKTKTISLWRCPCHHTSSFAR
jgi:hypothetical protein